VGRCGWELKTQLETVKGTRSQREILDMPSAETLKLLQPRRKRGEQKQKLNGKKKEGRKKKSPFARGSDVGPKQPSQGLHGGYKEPKEKRKRRRGRGRKGGGGEEREKWVVGGIGRWGSGEEFGGKGREE